MRRRSPRCYAGRSPWRHRRPLIWDRCDRPAPRQDLLYCLSSAGLAGSSSGHNADSLAQSLTSRPFCRLGMRLAGSFASRRPPWALGCVGSLSGCLRDLASLCAFSGGVGRVPAREQRSHRRWCVSLQPKSRSGRSRCVRFRVRHLQSYVEDHARARTCHEQACEGVVVSSLTHHRFVM